MAVSDSFSELRTQIEQADESVKAAAAQDRAALETKLAAARKRADAHAAELRARGQEASEEAGANWQKLQSDWDAHNRRMHQRIDAKKAAFKADVAADDAEFAEADALFAIDFAAEAIDEAQYAVLAALHARMDAQVLAGAR